jgi:uncharacterized protein (TIGR03083 family)
LTKYDLLTNFVSQSYCFEAVAMDKDAVWAVIDRERADLADYVATLSAEQWATPSLCTGWTVREVVAHLTLTDIGPARVFVEFARYGGSLSRTARQTARRRARELAIDELVERLRALVGSRRHPIGTSYLDPLADVLVHGQDIAVPLGHPRPMPPEAAVAAAQRVASMGYWHWARRRLRSLRLEATDADWAFGSGAVVRGPIAVLLLVLTGRRARLDELSGEGTRHLHDERAGAAPREPGTAGG